MDDGSPRVSSNVLRQAVISCVKAELQQPYNLGVITREQFVKVCSAVTKDFLKEAGQGQTTLTAANEAHLRSHTTALLTRQLGAESPPAPKEQRAQPQHQYHQPPHHQFASELSSGIERHDFSSGVDTPGAVLASTDEEVVKYQDHLARLSAMTGSTPIATPEGSASLLGGSSMRSTGVPMKPSTPVLQHSEPVYTQRAMPSPVVTHTAPPESVKRPPVVSGGGGDGGHGHASTARQIHMEIVAYVKRIEELQGLISNHLEACEAAL